MDEDTTTTTTTTAAAHVVTRHKNTFGVLRARKAIEPQLFRTASEYMICHRLNRLSL